MRTTLKRMTCLFLALVMVMTLLPVGALAAGISPALVSSLAAAVIGTLGAIGTMRTDFKGKGVMVQSLAWRIPQTRKSGSL